ncbi:hypothetical protein [Enterococcus phage Phi_Eg_SY1]|nr:hypothetical protein [Enterococcus phage Phi_Eg_SY1]
MKMNTLELFNESLEMVAEEFTKISNGDTSTTPEIVALLMLNTSAIGAKLVEEGFSDAEVSKMIDDKLDPIVGGTE